MIMGKRQPNYDSQTDYDERLRNRYLWGAAYGISLFVGVALAYFNIRGYPQLLRPAEAALLLNMGLLVLAMVNQYRLPPFHLPGRTPDSGTKLQLFRLMILCLMLAPFSLSLSYFLTLEAGPQWFQVGFFVFVGAFGMGVILLAIAAKHPALTQ